MTTSAEQIPDVTVVGAGPVGLWLAAELALAGATVQVLERLAEPATGMKAASVNLPTAEALDRRGLLAAAEQVQREQAAQAGAFVKADDTRFTGHFAGMPIDPALVDWSDLDFATHTAAARARMVPQRELEALLTEHLEKLGVRVRRGVEVTSLTDHGHEVVAGTTEGPVRSKWLVGCDGGHSTVRKLAGIEFPGTDPEFTGYLAVADFADPEKLGSGWQWSPGGVYRYGPQPGRVTTVDFSGPPSDRTAPVTLEELQASLRRVSGTDVTITGLRGEPTRWTDNARQAASYRAGRVFLAGDAAHVHSPFGGQGLNLGFGDAMNLGWKLGAVIAGRSPESLLDSYDPERRPLGEWVLDWTRAQIGVLRGDSKSAALRQVVSDLLRTPDGATYAVKKISGAAQRIELPGEHELTGRFAPDLWLADGSRLAEHGHGGEFLLLDRTPDGRFAAFADGAERVVTVSDSAAMPLGVLVRPDGVVAWASDDADVSGLEDALHAWAGV